MSSFRDLAYKILKDSDKPMRVYEIWKKAVEMGLDKNVGAGTKTPTASVASKVYTDIRDNPNSPFEKTDRGYFWLKEKVGIVTETLQHNDSELGESDDDVASSDYVPYREIDLHSDLVNFMWEQFGLHCKTIVANRSGERGRMKWATPDIVGVDFKLRLVKDLRNLCNKANINVIELHAFELKRELYFGNCSESFFQATSNTSWANFSWLVSGTVNEDPEFINELKRLNQAFGVGIINLNKTLEGGSPVILFQARKKDVLDLDTMNKLCDNTDFLNLIKDIEDDIGVRNLNRNAHFDKINDDND